LLHADLCLVWRELVLAGEEETARVGTFSDR
jgi:hypothetical protein